MYDVINGKSFVWIDKTLTRISTRHRSTRNRLSLRSNKFEFQVWRHPSAAIWRYHIRPMEEEPILTRCAKISKCLHSNLNSGTIIVWCLIYFGNLTGAVHSASFSRAITPSSTTATTSSPTTSSTKRVRFRSWLKAFTIWLGSAANSLQHHPQCQQQLQKLTLRGQQVNSSDRWRWGTSRWPCPQKVCTSRLPAQSNPATNSSFFLACTGEMSSISFLSLNVKFYFYRRNVLNTFLSDILIDD